MLETGTNETLQNPKPGGPGSLPESHRVPIRTALYMGFGLIFSLWLLSAYNLGQRLEELESREIEVSDQFSHNGRLLTEIRLEVMLGAIYLREALLETPPEPRDAYERQVEESRQRIEKAFRAYLPVFDSPVHQENFDHLRRQVEDYSNTISEVVSQTAGGSRESRRNFVLPRQRDDILRLSESIVALNQQVFQQRRGERAQLHRDIERRIFWSTGLVVALSIAIAFSITFYAGRLESRIRLQSLRDLQSQRELQDLSLRLAHAHEEERRTIGRELHDEIGQALTAIKMNVALAQRSLEKPERAQALLEEARSIADHTVTEVRDLSQLLRPTLLDDLGLYQALDAHLRDYSRRTGLRAELVQENLEEHLPPELAICIYRIVQEALTNIAKHAQASSCQVLLRGLSQSVQVVIEDNGKGFRADPWPFDERTTGVGLRGMKERVHALEGTFGVETSPGKGTHLRIELPLREGVSRVRVTGVTAQPPPEKIPAEKVG
ncbi:MAG: histidine kinase [Terriglobia bacterium]